MTGVELLISLEVSKTSFEILVICSLKHLVGLKRPQEVRFTSSFQAAQTGGFV